MLAEGLGLPKLSGRGTFLAVLLVDSLGTGLFAPFSLLYFHDGVGLPLATVGLALSAAAFALPVAPLAGALVDRLGARRVVAAAQLLQGAGFLGCLVVDGAAALFVAALVVRVGQRAFWSSILTLVAEIATPNERDRWYGLAGAAQNAGTGAGGLLAGAAVAVGSPEPSRGRYLAAFQLSWAVAWVLAPTLFSLLFAGGAALPWMLLAGLALAAGVATLLVEGRLPAGAVKSGSEPA